MATICPYCKVDTNACGSFARMKEPTNWQTNVSRMTWMGPRGGYRFNVGYSPTWNWKSIAEMDGCTASELIWFNFRTDVPKEINWYLFHFVGCRYSRDGRVNLCFDGARPGVIYTRENHNGGGGATLHLSEFSYREDL